MKNIQTRSKSFLFAAVWAAALPALAPSAHAFSLNLTDDVHVGDANLCGDYNHLATYGVTLERSEKLPETEAALLTTENVNLIASELRARFTVPRSAGELRILSTGVEAGQAFAGSSREELEHQNRCFGKDFQRIFDFRFENGAFIPKNPGIVTYLRVAFDLPRGRSEPATIVIDRLEGKVYIHQYW